MLTCTTWGACASPRYNSTLIDCAGGTAHVWNAKIGFQTTARAAEDSSTSERETKKVGGHPRLVACRLSSSATSGSGTSRVFSRSLHTVEVRLMPELFLPLLASFQGAGWYGWHSLGIWLTIIQAAPSTPQLCIQQENALKKLIALVRTTPLNLPGGTSNICRIAKHAYLNMLATSEGKQAN